MNARHFPLVIGLLLALGTGILLLNYLGSLRASTAAVQTKTVVVAARDIPARAEITSGFVTLAARPTDQIDSDAIDDQRFVLRKLTLITIPAGSVMTKSKIAPASAFALPERLPIGMRAVSISVDRVKGVSGLIQPGDRVDVIAVPPRVGNETPHASAILRGALVLAIGNVTEFASATPSPENQNLTTVTLAVTPPQADLVSSADINTTLRLTLRPPKEPIRAFAAEPLRLGVPDRPPAAQAPSAVAPPATVPFALAVAAAARQSQRSVRSGSNVVVIDGDRQVEYGPRP